MVEVTAVYEGDLRCRTLHGPSGASFSTDAPKDNEGRGESFSPTDLVATALGACMLTIMGIYAKRHGLKLEGTTAVVKKEMAANPRRISGLPSEVRLAAGIPAEHRAALEKAALSCPVHYSLSAEISKPVSFVWPD